MADIKQIQFKRSNEPGKKPTASQLAEGELAINLRDRTLFTKDDQGLIVDLGFAKGGTVTGDINQTGNLNVTGTMTATKIVTVNDVAGDTEVPNLKQVNKITSDSTLGLKTTLANQGIGGTGPALSSLNWQTFDFVPGARYFVRTDAMTNVPAGVVLPSNTALQCIINVVGYEVSVTRHVELWFSTSTINNYRKYDIRTSGNPGSRSFTVRQIWTSNDVIPVENSGTGATTSAGARANLVAAKSGENSDITNLKSLQGALTLGGDPVGATDATTKRYVDNAIAACSGGSGTTMNGVMNYGVGEPSEWPGRAFIPGYAEPLDGQLLERAKRPDLWAFAQLFTPIDDALWLSDVTERGKYSSGDGVTTFRLPDWNGVQSGSIPGVFFRGGVGAADMALALNAAPNITGNTALVLTSQTTTSGGSLGDNWFNYWSKAAPDGSISDTYRENSVWIDASKSSLAYGRNNTSEVVPNNVSGVWIVRASGGFTATDTSWSVMNAVSNATSGQIVLGGKVISYAKAKEKVTTASMEVEQAVDLKAAIRFSINNPNGTTTVWRMEETGWPVNTVANGGTNTNITGLAALQGPLRLGGDGVSDYDAVTLRQARNMGGGGTGPSQTGVMNYGIGSRRLHDSRAWIPSYEVFGDGQLLNRDENPDLWAYAQLVGLIDDSVWTSTPVQRGHYSRGDGSTTFRVPDLNGVKKNGDESGAIVGDSIPGLYGRGDGGVSSNNGSVQTNASPDITGNISIIVRTGTTSPGDGAFSTTTIANNSNQGGSERGINRIKFKASDSHSAYGRDSTDEVRTNTFVGVWVIRASGAFTAANTSFHVINSDEVMPPTGVTVKGGEVVSSYRVGTKNTAQAALRATMTIGGAASAELVIRDNRSGSPVDRVIDIGALDSRVGYSVLDAGTLTGNNQTVNLTNPFGANTPVQVTAEIQYNGVWCDVGWIYSSAGTFGVRAMYVEGQGIVVKTGSALSSIQNNNGHILNTPDNYRGPAPCRVHVWKVS